MSQRQVQSTFKDGIVVSNSLEGGREMNRVTPNSIR